MRVHANRVVFRRPFVLNGMKGEQPPGTYSVETHDERSGIMSFFTGKRTSTWILICRDRGVGGIPKSVNIDPADLAAALKQDALPPEPRSAKV